MFDLEFLALLFFQTWVDKVHNIGFTLVPKCGSTSLRAIQFLKSGYFTKKTNFDHVTQHHMWPVEKSKHFVEKLERKEIYDLTDMTFVTAIRDPLNRLISAYKDKIGRGSLKDRKGFHKNAEANRLYMIPIKTSSICTQGLENPK